MKSLLSVFAGLATLTALPIHAQLLPGNFWPNSGFEEGAGLEDPVSGTVSGWSRGGGNVSICQILPKAFSESYGLAVVDEDNGYGEWYSDVSLAGRVTAGDRLDLRWNEVYQISAGEMRVSVLQFDSGGGLLAAKHFVVRGTSPGFDTSVENSPFGQRDETMDVTEGAATLRISLVSGGALETVGTYVIDELSVARHPAPILLAGNLWTNNPTFEEGEGLDLPDGTLTAWSRGGSKPGICQVTMENSISPTHALAVVDEDSGYGEWYSDLPLEGVAEAGDEINLQWFEIYNVSAGGAMRLTVLFLSASGDVVESRHFEATGQSAGWAGSLGASTFVRREATLTVPGGGAKLRVSLVSGGSLETTGLMVVDDISARKSAPPVPEVQAGNVWPNPDFEEGTGLDDPAGTPLTWNRGGNAPSLCVVSTANSVSPTHALGLEDTLAEGYAEWYANLRLGAATAEGRLLGFQWFELHDITDGEMRTTVLFFDAGNQLLAQHHFVVRGKSDGWKTSAADSTFTRRNEKVAVPAGARRMQVSMVSGGPAATLGTFLIDNLSVAPEPGAPIALFGNFLGNVGFEEGTALDNPGSGVPAGWQRGGGDPSINQILNEAYMSSTHALAVVDENTDAFGEWYRSVDLAGQVQGGEELDLQWWEMFSVSEGGSMRLSLVFFNGDTVVGQQHFVTEGQSAGWLDDAGHSFFTRRNERVSVPAGATRVMLTLTSGGPLSTTGVMLVDDLSLARPLPPPEILAWNLWPNPTFEEGTQLDNPTSGVPTGWTRGGTFIQGNRVNTQKATSPTHSLELADTKEDAYSEWYQPWSFGDQVKGGDTLDAQWFWLHDTTGDMRLSFLFFAADNSIVGQRHFVVRGQSEGWTGDLETAPFVKRRESIAVPETAVRGLVGLASGGSAAVMGTLILDDLSIRVDRPAFLSIVPEGQGFRLTWSSQLDRSYALERTSSLGPDAAWVPVASGLAGDADQTSFLDEAGLAGAVAAYYRVVWE